MSETANKVDGEREAESVGIANIAQKFNFTS